MRRARGRGLLLGAAVLWLAFVSITAGLIPVAASSGHWKSTSSFLHFVMRRSVESRALWAPEPPEIESAALVMRGAGHYERGCRLCHGAPGRPASRIFQHTTPAPPSLEARVGTWRPGELFYIVKHGVKFTGMPAWPAQHRDDEIWAMVAFLTVLDELTPSAYAALVGRPAMPSHEIPRVVEDCAACHGVDGRGRVAGAFPKLAGQEEAYLLASLEAYAVGERPSGIMGPIAAGLTSAEREAAARYFASRAPMQGDGGGVPEGKAIALFGVPAKRIPSCADCHGPTEHPRAERHPRLAGQDEAYLIEQLVLFQAGHRGGTPRAHLMAEALSLGLTNAQVRHVASYYARLADGPAD